MTSKELVNHFLSIAKENGYETFEKRAAYKVREYTIFTISFYKSSYGNFYYIRPKFDIINYNSNKNYELNKKFFSHDLGDLFFNSENTDNEFLDLEQEIPDELRIAYIKNYFEEVVNPLEEKLSSLTKVKDYIYENKWEFGCKFLLDYINDIEKK